MPTSHPNPLRLIGLARMAAGAGFVVTAVLRLPDAQFLVPHAGRLFSGDLGGTDAPIRAFFELLLIPTMLSLGIAMVVRGARWMRRQPVQGPVPLSPDEVTAVLMERRLPAYEAATLRQPWPLRSWLDEELGRVTGWRRDLIAQASRSFIRAVGLALLVLLVSTAAAYAVPGDVLGPLPLRFVLVYPFAAAVWAALTLLLIGSAWPRVEVIDLPVADPAPTTEQLLESPPAFISREPPALGTAIALTGVATQCALLSWWTLDTISYPHLATSVTRHLGTIIGGVLFFVLGARMVTAGTELLRRVQYDSVAVWLGGAGEARGAEIRTESRDPGGDRRIISAVASAHAREAALELLR